MFHIKFSTKIWGYSYRFQLPQYSCLSEKTTFTPSAGASQSALIAMSLVNDTMPLVFQGSDLLMPAKPSLHAGSSRIPGHSGTFQTLGLFQPSGPFTPSYFLDLLSRSTAFFCITLLALQKCKIDTNLVLSQIYKSPVWNNTHGPVAANLVPAPNLEKR